VCIALCTIVAHNIAQNRPDSFPPYPPDNHHISDDVYLREGRFERRLLIVIPALRITAKPALGDHSFAKLKVVAQNRWSLNEGTVIVTIVSV